MRRHFAITPPALTATATTAATPTAGSVSSSSHVLPLPPYFRAMSDAEQDAIDRLAQAYSDNYFGHIRFRKGWAEPQFKKADVEHAFAEAAQIVQRVRIALDVRASGAPRLRQLDGEAQTYLHQPEAAADFTAPFAMSSSSLDSTVGGGSSGGVEIAHYKFIRAVVHATLKDAKGYVEGLTATDVDVFIDAVTRHRFDPATHLRHTLAQMTEMVQAVEALRAERMAGKQNVAAFVESGSEAERAWRGAVGKMYEAISAMAEVSRVEGGKK
jgi:hypothetical protein